MGEYVIIGAGAAGIKAAEQLRKMDKESGITMVSVDGHVHSRCMLHKYLGHERTVEGINFVPEDFFEKNQIRWAKEKKVESVKPEEKQVILEGGEGLPYDKLLIATGAAYFIPPIPNFREAKNVYGFRDFSDAKAMDEAVEGKKRVFIVGSGLVGLDAASALCHRGYEVGIAGMAGRVMPLQTDDHAASVYQKAFEKAGCTFYLGIGVTGSRMDEEGNLTHVILSDGREIPCDVVMVAAGVRPQIGFLEGSGIETGRGIEVNEYLETSISDIYAAGDVTGLSGVWPDAFIQGRTAAMNMAGEKTVYEKPYPFKNTSSFFGITMLSLGKLDPIPEGAVVETEENRGTYKKAILLDGKLQGLLIQGDISNTGIYLELIKNQIDISGLKKSVFDLSYADFFHINEETGAFSYQE